MECEWSDSSMNHRRLSAIILGCTRRPDFRPLDSGKVAIPLTIKSVLSGMDLEDGNFH